ncbi:cryptochrome DASH [Striga asiatica]|uniref:Cryptochrome DASH n=1 Tax=Striga asiatica TaxID=4170 RepID=A0A5A7QFE4_STRAF|nr:cryptochrome DASH [Striga asiatica]
MASDRSGSHVPPYPATLRREVVDDFRHKLDGSNGLRESIRGVDLEIKSVTRISLWMLFELIWREYLRFLSIKQGNSIFHSGGPRNVKPNWIQDQALLDALRDSRTRLSRTWLNAVQVAGRTGHRAKAQRRAGRTPVGGLERGMPWCFTDKS